MGFFLFLRSSKEEEAGVGHSDRLVCTSTFSSPRFPLLFFFQPAIVDFVNCEQCIYVLFMVPQITLFSNFFIKNGSHNTIYTFKNYFATVFSVLVFSFSKNKLNPNTPIAPVVSLILIILMLILCYLRWWKCDYLGTFSTLANAIYLATWCCV